MEAWRRSVWGLFRALGILGAVKLFRVSSFRGDSSFANGFMMAAASLPLISPASWRHSKPFFPLWYHMFSYETVVFYAQILELQCGIYFPDDS